MKKNIFLTIIFLILIGFTNISFGESWNNNNVNCSTISDTSGQKRIASSNLGIGKPSIGSFNCETHGYYSGVWSSWLSIGTYYNCPDRGFASYLERRTRYRGFFRRYREYRVYCKKRDDTPPTINGSSLGGNTLATDNFNVYINYGVGQSGVGSFNAQIENFDNKNAFNNISLSGNSFNINLKKVDNDRTAGNYREYSLKLNNVCDEAGNCITGLPSIYKYNVYANTNNIGTFKFNSALDFTTGKIADGTPYQLKAILKDNYGNQIIPASGIGRTIDFNFNVSNNLKRNQYNNSGDAIYLTTPNNTSYTNKLTNNSSFNSLNSSNGEYPFNFKVYAPTINGNNFNINNVKVDVNGSLGNRQNLALASSSINFNFNPLYTLGFSGNQVNGLVEGVTQTGSINITKNGNETPVIQNTKKIYLQKYGTKKDEFNGKWIIGAIENNILNNLNSFINSFANGTNYRLKTLFTIKPSSTGFINDIRNVYLRTWLGYTIDSKAVLYKSRNIGEINTQNNIGLKIYGITNIDKSKQKDLTSSQNNNDIKNIAGEIVKSSLKRDIRKNAFEAIKNVNTDTTGINLMSGKVIFYDYRNEANRIKQLSGNIGSNKTIIILGANAYITGNLTVGGIIILKDNNGNGGNLYIDPNVTKIESVIYADKSALSYNTTWGEISPNNGGTYETLKKQLYINGSMFSENTIGGSRLVIPVCPFYKYNTVGFVCNLNEAQKYDLNYLRRGIDSKSNPSLADYPVIIEYDSKLQLNPPPLFSK